MDEHRREYAVIAKDGSELSTHDTWEDASRVVWLNEKHRWTVRIRTWAVASVMEVDHDRVIEAGLREPAELRAPSADAPSDPPVRIGGYRCWKCGGRFLGPVNCPQGGIGGVCEALRFFPPFGP